MGLVVNSYLARKSVCTCHAIGPTDEPKDLICFSPGIIGALSDRQDREFCREKFIKREDGIRKRVEKFREASKICKIETEMYPKGERLIPRIGCMSRELSKRDIST